MGLILIISLVILLIIVCPIWPYARPACWGLKASAMVLVVLAMVLCLVFYSILAFI